MANTRKPERLRLNSWGYNAARILSALAVIVENNGGEIQYSSYDRTYELTNRSAEILEKYRAEANDPIICTHEIYIKFVYNNDYYYYCIEENPVFDFYFSKYPISDGKYDANRYGMQDKKEWQSDCFFKCGCSDADITEAANMIFNMLVKSNYGALVTERKRVPNYYDNKYHYENIHEKRMVELF